MLFLLRKLKVLLRLLFRLPIQAPQKSDENSTLGLAGKPGTHSRRRTAPVNPDALMRRVSSPMRPPPAPLRTDAMMDTLFPRALEMEGSGRSSGASESSSSLVLVLGLMVSTMETGSSPINSHTFSTRASVSSSFQTVAVESLTTISGIGCNPHSKAFLHIFTHEEASLSSPEISSNEEISDPPLIDTKTPETPVSATSDISSTVLLTSLFTASQ
mmetsp:Transcript_1757/g.3828  ORF Transcript_1757/g.3828 Transcript_1757/m.3828 type:complete len:215 (+) Transcript_1757:3248-3892(+)